MGKKKKCPYYTKFSDGVSAVCGAKEVFLCQYCDPVKEEVFGFKLKDIKKEISEVNNCQTERSSHPWRDNDPGFVQPKHSYQSCLAEAKKFTGLTAWQHGHGTTYQFAAKRSWQRRVAAELGWTPRGKEEYNS